MQTGHSKRKKLLIGLLVILLLAAAAGAYYYFVYQSDDTASNDSPNASTGEGFGSLSIVPNLSGINDTIEFDGYNWVAMSAGVLRYKGSDTKFYDERHGLLGLQAHELVVFDDQLWVSTAEGVSRYSEENNTFVPYFEEATDSVLSNVHLFLNPISNKLSVSSFEDFHEYSGDKDEFESVTGPINTTNIIFTDTFGAAQTWIAGDAFNTLFTITKDDSGWQKKAELKSYVDQSVYLAQAEDQVVLYGRSTDYESCDSKGKANATVFTRVDDDGTLTALDDLSDEFADIELGPQYTAKGDQTIASLGCTPEEKEYYYEFGLDGDQITLTKGQEFVEPYFPQDEYADLVNELTSLFERDAYYRVLGVDSTGRLITASSNGVLDNDNQLGSSSIFNPTDSRGYDLSLNNISLVSQKLFATAEVVHNDEDDVTSDTVTTPVLCDGVLRYVFLTKAAEFEGEILTGKLVEMQDTLAPIVHDIQEDITQTVVSASCTDDALFWVDGDTVLSFNRDSKVVSKTEAELSGNMNSSTVDPAGDIWAWTNSKSIPKLSRYEVESGTLTNVELDGAVPLNILSVTHNLIWGETFEDDFGELVAYSHSGEVVYSFSLENFESPAGVALPEGRFVLVNPKKTKESSPITIVDTNTKEETVVNFDAPTSDIQGNPVVYNPTTNSVWVNSPTITYEIPLGS